MKTFSMSRDGREIPLRELEYRRSGNIDTEYLYHENGELQWIVRYEYGSEGLLEEKWAENEKGDQVWSISYTYDDQGRLLRETNHDLHNRPDYTVVYEYQNERTEIMAYGADGSLRWRKKEIRHTDRNVKETYFYYPDGSRIKGIIEEFNSRGRLDREIHIGEIGTVFRRIEIDYDELGRLAGRTVYNHLGDVHRRVWIEYLPHGHIGTVRQMIPHENRVEEYSYTYELDSRNTWLIRRENIKISMEVQKEVLDRSSVLIREIKYFPPLSEKMREP